MFSVQPQWSLNLLESHLGVDSETLKRRLVMWMNRGFIIEVCRGSDGDITYSAPALLGSGGEVEQGTDEEPILCGGCSSIEAQLEQDIRIYEHYVVGMLTNLESLPLSRIHNMLRMFVQPSDGDSGYNRTEAELQRFLNRLVEDGKLEQSGGFFRIRKCDP